MKGSLAQPGVIEENPESWFLWVLLFDSIFWENSRSQNKQKITLWILRRLGWTVLNYDYILEKWWWLVVTRGTTHKGGDTSAVIKSVIWANLSLWVTPAYFSASWGITVIRKWSLVIRTNLEKYQPVPLAQMPYYSCPKETGKPCHAAFLTHLLLHFLKLGLYNHTLNSCPEF